MAIQSPRVYDEVTLNFRRERGHLVCCFVTHVTEQANGQRAAHTSSHLSGLDERLVDLALAAIRQVVLDDVLSSVDPF